MLYNNNINNYSNMNTFYKENNNEILIFKHAYINNIPLMLTGPTGSGKSRFVEKMSKLLNNKLIQVACNDETSSIDLQGRYLIKNGNTYWKYGPAAIAAKKGYILYLDEIIEAKDDVIIILHPLADHRREIYIDKRNEIIKAKKNFMLIGSYNPDNNNKIKELKISTKQRFITINFKYPKSYIEEEIICKESNIDKYTSKKIVFFANKIRNIEEIKSTVDISTRILINTSKLISSGINPILACNIGIINTITENNNIIKNLNNLLKLIF